MLNSAGHVDEAPATVWAKLLDEGRYLASERTMYRILADHDEVKERRRQATHPAAKKPELMADATEPRVVMGHHTPRWRGEVDLVLPVRDHRHLLPLRAGLDAGHRREPHQRQSAARRHDPQAEHPGRAALHPLRSRLADGREAGGVHARRARCHQEPQPAPRLQRQPLQRIPVPHPEVSARVPRPVRVVHPRPPALRPSSSTGTTSSTATPASGSTPPSTSTTATPRPCARSARSSSTAPTPCTPNASSDDRQRHQRCPAPSGSTNPTRRHPRLSDSSNNLPHQG